MDLQDFNPRKCINDLPDEVLDYILALVSTYGDLRNCYLVSRRWRSAVQRVVHNHELAMQRLVPDMKLLWSSCSCQNSEGQQITKRYSHSAIYDDTTMAMFVFGGCTSTSTTFNDLWRLDLTSRKWQRPISTGTYPSPKACSVLVRYEHENQDDPQPSGSFDEPSRSHRMHSSLILFGGWTHPSLYPLHQSWRLFNELHRFDIESNHWTQITPESQVKPPPMAGHSATVHGHSMIIFGGLQKQRSSIGQFSSSNDVWSFNIKTNCWVQEDVPEPRPQARYGQSQLFLDERHLLILGGSGGPSNIFNDVWLLIMEPPHWRWVECEVKNAEKFGALHMWCHPACKVGNYAVILGKNRSPKPSASPQVTAHREARWNIIPQLRRGLNRGYGAIRRPNNPQNARNQVPDGGMVQRRSQSLDEDALLVRSADVDGAAGLDPAEDMSVSSDSEDLSVAGPSEEEEEDFQMEIAVEPVNGNNPEIELPQPVYRSTVTLDINPSTSTSEPSSPRWPEPSPPREPRPGPSMTSPSNLPGPSSRPFIHVEPLAMPRMQAFATSSSSSGSSASSNGRSAFSAATRKQVETRQRQLESLRRMEERYRNLSSSQAAAPGQQLPPTAANKSPQPRVELPAEAEKVKPGQTTAGLNPGRCSCHRLAMYVLDISRAMSDEHLVEWLPFRSNASLSAPEETILYTLVAGRSELIMFGGIQKDVSTIASGRNAATDNETVFNDVYFLTPPIHIV